jgi:hypothetical protein
VLAPRRTGTLAALSFSTASFIISSSVVESSHTYILSFDSTPFIMFSFFIFHLFLFSVAFFHLALFCGQFSDVCLGFKMVSIILCNLIDIVFIYFDDMNVKLMSILIVCSINTPTQINITYLSLSFGISFVRL